jgi:hypothetical protein
MYQTISYKYTHYTVPLSKDDLLRLVTLIRFYINFTQVNKTEVNIHIGDENTVK